MKLSILLWLVVASVAAADPVADCRAAHAADPQAHIACLEDALRARGDAAAPAEAVTPARPQPPAAPDATEIAVTIVATSYNGKGLATFRCADGQVWRETMASPERRRLDPEREYTARIVRGTFGGYRMHVDGVRWMKTVERIE